VGSLDLRPSNQYILARVIPSIFRLAKMCSCEVSLLSRCSPFLGEAHIVYLDRGEARFSFYGECDVDRHKLKH
jgi:hypothetical protein